MIRVIKQRGKYYGVEFESVEDEADNIQLFVEENTPVIIVNRLSDIDEMDLNFTSSDIKMID